jgi:hypothetical protein
VPRPPDPGAAEGAGGALRRRPAAHRPDDAVAHDLREQRARVDLEEPRGGGPVPPAQREDLLDVRLLDLGEPSALPEPRT